MNMFIKTVIYLGLFSLLHFGYEMTRFPWLKPFCGINESIFQHLKMAYWAYILASIIEFFSLKKKKAPGPGFITSRMLAAVFVPWVIVLVWYLAPATVGKIKSPGIELVWAITVSAFSGVSGIILEKNVESAGRLSLGLKLLAIFLVLAAGFLFVAFSYNLPWIDMFVDPASLLH